MAELAKAAAGDGHCSTAAPPTLQTVAPGRAAPETAVGTADPLESACDAHREVRDERAADDDAARSTATEMRSALCEPTASKMRAERWLCRAWAAAAH